MAVLLWGGSCVSPASPGVSPSVWQLPCHQQRRTSSRQRGRGGQDSTRTGKSPVAQLARASLMGHTMTGTHLMGLGSVAAWDRL